MKMTRSASIRSQLALLVIGCVLPALIMAVLLISYNYRQAKEQLVRNSMATARAMAAVVDAEFASVTASLNALATSPSLAANDMARFYVQAKDVLRAQQGDNIVLSDFNGNHYFNTLRPYGEVPRRPHIPEMLKKMAQTGEPVISDLFLAPTANRLVIAVGVPVRHNGQYAYSLAAGIFPERFAKILHQQSLPADWIAGVFDGSGTIVARTHDSERFVGKSGAPDILRHIGLVKEGMFEGMTSEGIPVLTVFSHSAVANWTVAIGIPTSSLANQLWRTLSWLILATAILLAASLGLAWLIGGRIARSIHGLVEPALALGAGQAIVVPPLQLKEAEEVSAALIKASEMLQHAQHQANHDGLTGLSNRGLFKRIVEQQLVLCQRKHCHLSILYIDLDGFKSVNDQHGHATGDKLLRAVAERLKSGIRESDLAARLGGDEFAVVLVDATTDEAVTVANKLVASLSSPYVVDELVADISASIGIAGYPDSGTTGKALLDSADAAMYEAKARGKRRVAVAKPMQAK